MHNTKLRAVAVDTSLLFVAVKLLDYVHSKNRNKIKAIKSEALHRNKRRELYKDAKKLLRAFNFLSKYFLKVHVSSTPLSCLFHDDYVFHRNEEYGEVLKKKLKHMSELILPDTKKFLMQVQLV